VISPAQAPGGPEEPAPSAGGRWWRRGRRPGWMIGLAVLTACWTVGFAVNNLAGGTGFVGSAVDRVFPRVAQGDRIDDRTVQAAWEVVREQYVRREVSGAAGTQGAVGGIVEMLHSCCDDRFSAFFTHDQFATLQDDLAGRRSGSIGVVVEPRCAGGAICAQGAPPTVVAITAVLRNQPAERAGVRRGDIVVSVDGTTLSSLGSDVGTQIELAGARIRGRAGTTVTLGLRRGDQSLELPVTRADLQIPTVYSQRFGPVLYVQVTTFGGDTGKDIKRVLADGLSAGTAAVVLDLRHNPGGLVSAAQAVASQFLTRGQSEADVLVRLGRLDARGDPGSAQKVERDPIEDGGVAQSARLAVLVDADSASAAEIVAAALHDYHRATLLGVKTFGKGSVQEDFPLPDGSDLHLTVEKWFGPDGESIDGTGITPDKTVALPDDDHRFRLDSVAAEPSQDAQLQAAIAALQEPAAGLPAAGEG